MCLSIEDSLRIAFEDIEDKERQYHTTDAPRAKARLKDEIVAARESYTEDVAYWNAGKYAKKLGPAPWEPQPESAVSRGVKKVRDLIAA